LLLVNSLKRITPGSWYPVDGPVIPVAFLDLCSVACERSNVYNLKNQMLTLVAILLRCTLLIQQRQCVEQTSQTPFDHI